MPSVTSRREGQKNSMSKNVVTRYSKQVEETISVSKALLLRFLPQLDTAAKSAVLLMHVWQGARDL